MLKALNKACNKTSPSEFASKPFLSDILTKGCIFCLDFAQSYLRTIPKTEPNFSYNNEKWKMAIDVETELYKLCLLDLNSKSLSTFKPTSLNKYLNK